MTPREELRAKCAEAIAISYCMATDADLRIVGVDHEELKRRALLKLQMDPALKFSLTIAIDHIETACMEYSDARINSLLQDGMQTFTLDGRMVEVEIKESRLKVTSILTGAGLDVSDGAFVIFIDSRCSGSEALKRWERLVGADTRLMIIPLSVPTGQTIEMVVAAKRQEEEGFAG